MVDESFRVLLEHIVDDLDVSRSSECRNREGLSDSSLEKRRTVDFRKDAELSSHRPDLVHFPPVQPHFLFKDRFPHMLFDSLIYGFLYLSDSHLFRVFRISEPLSHIHLEPMHLLVEFRLAHVVERSHLLLGHIPFNLLVELFVENLRHNLALRDGVHLRVFAQEVGLSIADLSDDRMSELEGSDHLFLADLVSLGFDHGDGIRRAGYGEIELRGLQLLHVRVEFELSISSEHHSHSRNRSFEFPGS